MNKKIPSGTIYPGISALPGKNNPLPQPSLWQDGILKNNGQDTDDVDQLSDDEIKRMVDEFITRKEDWARTHPGNIVCGSDSYYAELVNIISITLGLVNMPPNVPKGLVNEIAMSVAAYLEDMVSGFGVWNAIRNLHKKIYGKWLPFYDCDHEEYLLDNVNIEDVKFLVWQSFCRCGQPEDMVYSPFSEGVDKIANLVYDMIVDRFEYAPEATRINDYIRKVFRKGDYFEIRSLAEWLVLRNPLVRAPNMYSAMLEEAGDMNESRPEYPIDTCVYYIQSLKAWTKYVGPLGCCASIYLAEMCRERGLEQRAATIEDLRCINIAQFLIKEAGKKEIILQDATGEQYAVARNSFGPGTKFNNIKGFITSIVKYGDTWMQNGMAIGLTENPFKITKNISTYHSNKKSRKLVQDAIEKHNGRRIFYCRDMKEAISILGLPGLQENKNAREADNYVLMLSDYEEPITLENDAFYFKDKENPFYNKKIAKEEAFSVVMYSTIPDDIAQIIDERKLLPDASIFTSQGKRFGKAVVQDNMRFWLGFYRSKNPVLEQD